MGESTKLPKHLVIKKRLGQGAYGTVHLCEDLTNGKEVAVKHVRHAALHGKSMIREVRLLAQLKHENILHLIDFPALSGHDFDDMFLVLPYLPTDLHRVIQSDQELSDRQVQVIICQIFRALDYLHDVGVAHRDLKPANILLERDCRVKVCDFGLARGDMPNQHEGVHDEQSFGMLTEYVVTRWYRAPEVMLLPKRYTSAVDLWSAGCILAEMLGRKALFPGKNHMDMIARIASVIGSPSEAELTWISKESKAYQYLRKACPKCDGTGFDLLYPKAPTACVNLLYGLLMWDPSQRFTAAEAQRHEYMVELLPADIWENVRPQPFDWSFDDFQPTHARVKRRLYQECLRFHPEMLLHSEAKDSLKVATENVAQVLRKLRSNPLLTRRDPNMILPPPQQASKTVGAGRTDPEPPKSFLTQAVETAQPLPRRPMSARVAPGIQKLGRHNSQCSFSYTAPCAVPRSRFGSADHDCRPTPRRVIAN